MPTQNDEEEQGLKEIRRLIHEYLQSPEGDSSVKTFLKNLDDEIILQFFRGRKYDATYAFETLKKNGEVKLLKFPDMFPEKVSESVKSIQHTNAFTILKHRDDQGRRIVIFDSRKWDLDKHSMNDMQRYGVLAVERLIRDEDAMKNGIVGIHDSSGLGFRLVKQYSVKAIKQIIAIFWHAYPLRYGSLHSVNTPYLLAYAISLARYFFPQKLKERLMISSPDKGFTDLHKVVSPNKLPKFLGGDLEYEDAVDQTMTITF